MFNIKKIYLTSDCKNYPLAHEIINSLDAETKITNDLIPLMKEISNSEDPQSKGKEVLILTKNRGDFLKKCPGTKYYRCCNYQILHVGSFCPMDCSYCILQTYFHPPAISFFLNQEKMEDELDKRVFNSNKIWRIGTGEFTDSLVWDELFNYSKYLVNLFKGQKRAILELKTKTVNIENLLELDHNKKTIVSWSLNTPKVIEEDERDTTTLEQRLEAASICEKQDYKLAFHFDPIVIYPGCSEDYKKAVRKIFDYVSPENIVYISLGTFRFMPDLKDIIKKRFSDSKIWCGEFFLGTDNKMRYLKTLRIDVFKSIHDEFMKIDQNLCLYFCMEDDKVWERVFGYPPKAKGGLANILDQAVQQHCGVSSH
ncbi:MAG: radical SAM protein [Desulforegulaceae bacterium]|nr:radical SAM protein [Desulforegulaceae bacterium]